MIPSMMTPSSAFGKLLAARHYFEALQRGGSTGVKVESPTLCSRPYEEFIADFDVCCRRALAGDPALRRALDRLIAGAGSVDLAAQAAVAERCGRALLALEPYPMYPLFEYFETPIKTSLRSRFE